MKEMLLVLCWMASFAGQLWGWIEWLRVPWALAPLITMSVDMLLLYAGGMLGLLSFSAWLVLFSGLGLFLWMLIRRSRALMHLELLMFALACVALWLRYHASLLTAYDDFSHWGTIVRHMLTHDRLPTAQDELITFQSYPPGAACWAYYVCYFLGSSDGMMLTAQAALTLTGWFSLLGLMQKKTHIAGYVIVAATTMVGLSLFQGTASLMVDNLLSALAVGAVCFVIKAGHRPWLTGMLAATIALVKDSGLFFAAITMLLYAASSRRSGKGKNLWLRQMLQVCLPVLVTRGVWLAHVKLDFPAAVVSRHALTLENLRISGADKSYADMLSIGKKLLVQSVSLHNQSVQILLLTLLAAAVVVLLRRIYTRRWSLRTEAWLVASCSIVYAVWTGFLWLMYIFSMPLGNSLQLVAYERYNSTCALFLYGVLAAWLLTLDTRLPKYAAACAVLTALLPLLTSTWTAGIPRLIRENYHVPLRSAMESLAQQRMPTENEAAAVVVSPENNNVYAGYMARYVFLSPQIAVVSAEEAVQIGAQVFYIACEETPLLPEDVEVVRLP